MLTDKQIEDIAQRFFRSCGDHWNHQQAIPESQTEDFARAIEKAVLFDELKTWTMARWQVHEKKERCSVCSRAFWGHIKDKMNLGDGE